jgi:hypothetical protein
VTIDFSPEVAQKLDEEARVQGTTPESLVIIAVDRLLSVAQQEPERMPARSLADRLAPHIGVLDSGALVPGGARMSERRGEYAEMLMRDHLRGRP